MPKQCNYKDKKSQSKIALRTALEQSKLSKEKMLQRIEKLKAKGKK